jgi:hypothetical protein
VAYNPDESEDSVFSLVVRMETFEHLSDSDRGAGPAT